MKIELESPYKEVYYKGNLRIGSEGRQIVDLWSFDGNQTSTLYSRYLVTVKLGRFLPKDVEVDHIDGDRTNDQLDNLQVLSKIEHAIKTASERPAAKKTTLICPICEKSFEIEERKLLFRNNPCCSKSCGAKQGRLTAITNGSISEERLKLTVTRICPICSKEFEFFRRGLSQHPNPCCSKICGRKKAALANTKHGRYVKSK